MTRPAPIECGTFNLLVAARHGHLLVNRHDIYIGRSIRELGEFSEGEVDLFRQVLRPGALVVEAGANIGSHTVPMAKMIGPTGHLWAFEPQRVIHQTLCANLALNSLTNVTALWAAVGRKLVNCLCRRSTTPATTTLAGLVWKAALKASLYRC